MAKAQKSSRRDGKGAGSAPQDQDGYQARTVPLDEGTVEFRQSSPEKISPGETLSQTEVSMDGPMCAADVMTASVKTATVDTDVATIAALMRDENIGLVPIVGADRQLAGVITDRDIVVRVDAQAAPVDRVRAQEVMTTALVTVRVDDDLQDVIDRMGSEGLQRVLVVDHSDRLVGVVSVSDLARRTNLPERVQDTLDQIARHHRK